MRVVITGSRTWRDGRIINRVLAGLREDESWSKITVIHGNAQGADRMAAQAAHCLWYRVDVMPADWETYGRQAGYLRNIRMLDRKPDLVVAFWDGKSNGTRHSIKEALRRMVREGSTLRRVDIHLQEAS